jgi:hypothetical protein
MVRGLVDLTSISQLLQLRYLFLQDLKQVTQLPSFKETGKFAPKRGGGQASGLARRFTRKTKTYVEDER